MLQFIIEAATVIGAATKRLRQSDHWINTHKNGIEFPLLSWIHCSFPRTLRICEVKDMRVGILQNLSLKKLQFIYCLGLVRLGNRDLGLNLFSGHSMCFIKYTLQATICVLLLRKQYGERNCGLFRFFFLLILAFTWDRKIYVLKNHFSSNLYYIKLVRFKNNFAMVYSVVLL